MTDALERLVDSLLFEGYALYPYTPTATKNATPTPFGIVYPPGYAAHRPTTFDVLRMECLAEAPAAARLTAEVRFLHATGARHEAAEQRIELPPAALGERVSEERRLAGLTVRVTLRSERLDTGRVRIALCVHNLTAAPADVDRAEALRWSLISTHPILRLSAGRFISPLEAGSDCHSVNTWPVLASPEDDAILGAAIVLPDHPQLAPESLGGLFDSTEIEEALLLHVKALSDEERAAIDQGDPTVKAMIDRAAAATPDDVLALHGRLTLEPPTPSPAVRDPSRGEEQAEVDGVVYRRGAKVMLRPGPEADLHARMVEGRTATIERIYVDMEGKAYLAVTIDGDPGQQLLRETNRFLFFFTPEVELVRP